VRAEILAMMGTFEESNRIVNDIKGRREPKLPGSKRQYNDVLPWGQISF
jgi:hypothetical protein